MNSLTGYLLVNKPSGPTSYDIIRWIKRSIQGVKIGHSGTLDPLASGLLIVLLGKATKQQDRFMKMEKTYLLSLRLGIQTDSGDETGETIRECPIPLLDEEKIQSSLQKFLGAQNQIPPMYSALKKNGVPLYKLARKGQVVEREPRAIQIHELTLIRWKPPAEMELMVRCSSGTYVRTLAEDVAADLGTCGMMTALVREKIGPYSIDLSISAETMRNMTPVRLAESILPLESR